MTSRGERGIWQRRYWEHTIRDDRDLAAHMDYTHFNPVKRGLVARPADWPHPSFHRCVDIGLYSAG
jgi:putative transposase